MKACILLISILLIHKLYCQGQTKVNADSVEVWNPTIDSVSKVYDVFEKGKGFIINKIIDSLNSYSGELPRLLDNIYIDYEFEDAYFVYGKDISTRNYILERVNNINALNAILISKNSFYSAKLDSIYIKNNYEKTRSKKPFVKYSLKELVKKRKEDLIK